MFLTSSENPLERIIFLNWDLRLFLILTPSSITSVIRQFSPFRLRENSILISPWSGLMTEIGTKAIPFSILVFKNLTLRLEKNLDELGKAILTKTRLRSETKEFFSLIVRSFQYLPRVFWLIFFKSIRRRAFLDKTWLASSCSLEILSPFFIFSIELSNSFTVSNKSKVRAYDFINIMMLFCSLFYCVH